jgi:hypothetical protein
VATYYYITRAQRCMHAALCWSLPARGVRVLCAVVHSDPTPAVFADETADWDGDAICLSLSPPTSSISSACCSALRGATRRTWLLISQHRQHLIRPPAYCIYSSWILSPSLIRPSFNLPRILICMCGWPWPAAN